MGRRSIIIEPELLWSLYWGKEYSLREIGRQINVHSSNIFNKMKKYSIPRREHSNSILRGEEHPSSIPINKLSYDGLHIRLRKHKPKPLQCSMCGEIKKLELANISGKYKRDIRDFIWVCRSCHMWWDGRIKNLKYM